MKIIVPVCILCEEEDVQLWTLHYDGQATLTYVCTEHAAPLHAIMEASEGLPLDMQVPVAKKTAELKAHNEALLKRPRRPKGMEPLNWTPPTAEEEAEKRSEAALKGWATRSLRDTPSDKQVVSPDPVVTDIGVAVEFSNDAPEVGAGGDGDDLGVAGGGEVHDAGLQALEGSYPLDGLEHERGGAGQVSRGDVVVDQVEVA